MAINMVPTRDFFHFAILLVNMILIKYVAPTPIISSIRYCDDNRLIKLTSDQCSGGINFGDNRPDCVCITGIYRFWMDTCLLHEGYSFDGCSTLFSSDDNTGPQVDDLVPPWEKETISQVIGLQFALGSANSIEDYTSETLAAFSENDTDYEPLKVIRVNEDSMTSASKIYYTNSETHLQGYKNDASRSPFICVGKSMKGPRSKICLLERSKFSGTSDWLAHYNPMKVEVRSTLCSENLPSDMYSLKLIPDWCFDMITKAKSECSLSCDSNEGKGNDTSDPNPPSSGESSIEGGEGKDSTEIIPDPSTNTTRGNHSLPRIDSEEEVSGEQRRTNKPPTVDPYENKLKDCKEPTIGEIKNQHNSFLNRKLNHWSKLRQVGQLDKPILNKIKPIRTFRILDIVKQIAQKTCPNSFVSPIFFDQAVDLFVILHKGREYRFTEDLELKDSIWIEKILHSCNMDAHPIRLYSDESSDSGCHDFEKAEGYCQSGSMETNDCDQIPLNISQEHSEFKHHFVVDAAWDLIDLIQIVCFDKFAESYRMFHAWEQSSEKLFTREIRKLWVQPKLDRKVYQNLLTPTAVIDMYNLEMCIEAAYHMNPVLTRLLRPPEPKRFFRRKKRSPEDDADRIGTNYDVFCRKDVDNFYTPC